MLGKKLRPNCIAENSSKRELRGIIDGERVSVRDRSDGGLIKRPVGNAAVERQKRVEHVLERYREGQIDSADDQNEKDAQAPKAGRAVKIAVEPETAGTLLHSEGKAPLALLGPPKHEPGNAERHHDDAHPANELKAEIAGRHHGDVERGERAPESPGAPALRIAEDLQRYRIDEHRLSRIQIWVRTTGSRRRSELHLHRLARTLRNGHRVNRARTLDRSFRRRNEAMDCGSPGAVAAGNTRSGMFSRTTMTLSEIPIRTIGTIRNKAVQR
jgi:hypothetical protein